MDLTQLFPQPITIAFAGRRIAVRPLRLRQLAELQAWLNDFVPSPADAAAETLAREDLDDEARRRLLVNAYLDAEKWPISIGSITGDYLLDTSRGRRELLRVASGLEPEVVIELAADAEDADWSRLDRACFGSDPLMLLARLIDPLAFAAAHRDREPIPWAKLVCEAAKDGGWTIDQVGELTLGQIVAFRTGGKRDEPDIPPRPGESRDEACARRAAYFDLGEEEEVRDGN